MMLLTPKDEIPDYDPRTKKHCWVIFFCLLIPDDKLEAPEELAVLGEENLACISNLRCFHCHASYSTISVVFPCPGDPVDD